MPRNTGREKIQEYLSKHNFARRWISIMMVMSLLVTCVTLYAMNRGASAVTEEGAEEIGMVLDEYSGEGGNGGEDGQLSENENGDSEDYVSEEDEENSESGEVEEISESEDNAEESDSAESSDTASEDNAENSEDDGNSENAEIADNEETSENTDTTENADNEEAAEADEEKTAEGKEELTKDVKLTVSYVDGDQNLIIDEEGEAYADEKEANIEESMEFPEDARNIDGYEFKKVTLDKLEIKKITKLTYQAEDETEYTYYELLSEEEPLEEMFPNIEAPDYKYDVTEDGEYLIYIKDDTNLLFTYEKPEDTDTADQETENADENKVAEEDIPESVDLSEYVTETVVERENEDGTWEVIEEADIKLGDHLRITVKYSMPTEASLSDDIHMDVPEQFGNAISTQSELENGEGTVETTEDNKIIVNFSDEYKKEKIAGDSENITGEDAENAENTKGQESIRKDTEGNTEENAKEETSDKDSALDDSAKIKTGGVTSALFALFSPVVDFFRVDTIVAHAANGSYGTQSGAFTYETIVDSTDLGGMKITGVSVKKNPTITSRGGQNVYSGGTPITSGSEVGNGEGLIFTLEYFLEVGTVSPENPSITYALSKHGIQVEQAASGSVYNGNNKEVGTFTIDNKGIVTITFHEEFAKKNATNIIDDSFFFFYATANLDGNKDRVEKRYDFGNDVSFTVIVVNKKSPDISIEKKILEDYNKQSKTIKYQVVLSSVNGTETDIYFKDYLGVYNNTPSDKSYSGELSGSFSMQSILEYSFVKRKANGREENVSLNIHNSEFSLGKLNAGEKYIFTYKVRFPDNVASYPTDLRVVNWASATIGNNNTREAQVHTDLYGTAPSVRKYGEVDKNKKEVTWTIVVNEGHVNLKNYILYDFIHTFAKDGWNQVAAPYSGDFTVTEATRAYGQSSGQFNKGSKFIIGSYGYTFQQDDYSKYVIKCTYKYAETDIIYGNLKNEVQLLLKNGKGNKQTSQVWIGDFNPLDKWAQGVRVNGNGTATVSWKVRLNAPLTRNEGTNKSEYWVFYERIKDTNEVFTNDDINKLKNAIKNVYTGRFDVTTKDSANIGNISGYKTLEIKFYDDIRTTVDFSFTTTGSIGDGKNPVQFGNSAAAYNKNVYDRTAYQSYEPFIKKYDGNNIQEVTYYDYNTDDTYKQGILTWIVEVNIPVNNQYGTLYVVDKLPENVTLIENGTYNGAYLYGVEICDSNSFRYPTAFNGNSASYGGITYTKSGDSKNVIISFDGNRAVGRKIYFRFRAKIASDFDFKTIGTGEFTNSVVLSRDSNGNDTLGTASQTQRVTRTEYAMTKTSQLAAGSINTMEYTLDVNEAAADLLQGGDTLTLTDTLNASSAKDFSAYLVPDSVKVYVVNKNERGEEKETELSSSEYSYNVSSYDTNTSATNDGNNLQKVTFGTIVFKIPDERHLRVRYRYTFNGEINTFVTLSNDAKLEGVVVEKDSANNTTKVQIQDAGARANVRGINLYKVDAENSGTLLSGAVFSLYYYNGRDWVLQKNEKTGDGKFVTDSNGLAVVAPLDYNVAYKLVEEKAPEGYIKDDTPVCFYIPSADMTQHPLRLPDNFYTELSGSEFAAGQPVYVGNHKDSTSITVKKEWKNADDVTKPSSIFVNIGRRLGNPLGKAGDSQIAHYYTVNIERKNPRGKLTQYIGYPSVKSGTKLTVTFYTHNTQYYSNPSKLVINGSEENYKNGLNSNGLQQVTKTITITGNTNIQIVDSDATADAGSITASLGAPEESFDTSNGAAKAGNLTVGSEDTSFSKEITITGVDGWSATVSGLDRYYTDEKTGIKYEWLYYVSEVASLYYSASYSDNNSPGINAGTITITNTRNEVMAYALPSTGGTGKLPFTIAGLSLATIALLAEEYYRRKRRKEK